MPGQGKRPDTEKYYLGAVHSYRAVLLGEESPQFEELLRHMDEADVEVPSPPPSPRLAGFDLVDALRQGKLEGLD